MGIKGKNALELIASTRNRHASKVKDNLEAIDNKLVQQRKVITHTLCFGIFLKTRYSI